MILIYNKIFSHDYKDEEEVVEQVINFNLSLLTDEPQFYPASFIIAILYYRKCGNSSLALKYFDLFIKSTNQNSIFFLLTSEANKYMNEIKEEIGY